MEGSYIYINYSQAGHSRGGPRARGEVKQGWQGTARAKLAGQVLGRNRGGSVHAEEIEGMLKN